MSDQKKSLERPATEPEMYKVNYSLEVDFDEFRKPKKMRVDAQPHEQEAVNSAIAAILAGSNDSQVASINVKIASILLSDIIHDFRRDRLASRKWTAKTEAENLAVYDLLIRIIGDSPITNIGDEEAVTYLQKLQKLPANINKIPTYKNKQIDEIVSLSPLPMSVRSVNKNIERISSLFKWAVSRGKYGITHNPFSGRSLDESKSGKRQPFSMDELIQLFSSEEFTTRRFRHSYMYWLPIMGILTGARLGELCQLHLCDFVVLEGVHCISINDEEEKKIKNSNAQRLVPLHSQLIEMGIIRHVENLREKSETRLFPELELGRDGYSTNASKWFARYKERCGILNKHTKVFHSFRHTFISSLLDDEVAEHSVAQIVGHEASLITGRVYWNARDAAKRKPTVEKYQLPERVLRLIPRIEEVKIIYPPKGKGIQT